MSDLCRLIWCALIGVFRPRATLQAENLVLRHQLNVLRRKSPKRLAFGDVDRLVFTALYHVAPEVLDALKILKPQTVIRWHRAGFRTYWRWKSRPRSGRLKTPAVAPVGDWQHRDDTRCFETGLLFDPFHRQRSIVRTLHREQPLPMTQPLAPRQGTRARTAGFRRRPRRSLNGPSSCHIYGI
jgi:hypothetical protein